MRAVKSAIPRNGGAGVLPPSSASVASSSVDGVADVDVDPASYLFPTGEPPVAYYGDEDFAADECMLVHDVTMAEDPSADVTTMLHSLPVEVQSLFSRIRQVWVDKVRTIVLWMWWLCQFLVLGECWTLHGACGVLRSVSKCSTFGTRIVVGFVRPPPLLFSMPSSPTRSLVCLLIVLAHLTPKPTRWHWRRSWVERCCRRRPSC